MAIDLPEPIAHYFTADQQRDGKSLADCFTANGTVIDEGNTYAGREAIRQWMANASTQYAYTVQPLAIAQDDDRFTVTSRLEGNFPGSPVDLRYVFTLDAGQIAALTIAP
ncbi:MAG: nuclear transport factor 2 family protein [Sphingomonadales bacterium]|nr:nuclear transport factor 2 family protein [Sphingomonadales bacterium]NCQ21163.1 nuclear transport factor 2 family protein [Sphingomonadales bacterium]NCT03936.1 nuclear transport factor 2 family protein [Sphingomonadales bacterium]